MGPGPQTPHILDFFVSGREGGLSLYIYIPGGWNYMRNKITNGSCGRPPFGIIRGRQLLELNMGALGWNHMRRAAAGITSGRARGMAMATGWG